MKKLLAIALISLYLCSTTEFLELIKIPALVSHFIDHQSLNNRLSFSDFVQMHYSDTNSHAKTDHRDTKLPFKCCHSCLNSSFFLNHLSSLNYFEFNGNLDFVKVQKPIFGYKFSFVSNFQSSIWQPPKIY